MDHKAAIQKDFLDSITQELHALEQAYNGSLTQELLALVHRLHGAAAFCGFPELREAAKLLEVALRDQHGTDIIEERFTILKQEISRLTA